jgi:hypothetical protein
MHTWHWVSVPWTQFATKNSLSRQFWQPQCFEVTLPLWSTSCVALNVLDLTVSENRSSARLWFMSRSNEVNTGSVLSTVNWVTAIALTPLTTARAETSLMSDTVLLLIVSQDVLCVAPMPLNFIEFRSATDNNTLRLSDGANVTTVLVLS